VDQADLAGQRHRSVEGYRVLARACRIRSASLDVCIEVTTGRGDAVPATVLSLYISMFLDGFVAGPTAESESALGDGCFR
jgi:hypothetical protein